MIIINKKKSFETLPMLHTYELSDLLAPVIHRANIKSSILADKSALHVLEKLGISTQYNLSLLQQQKVLARCQWIDQQLLSYFQESPKTECIEVNGGLSTRFHRLSEKSDWPQFSWCAINPHDINDCLQYVFPKTDNYRSLGDNNSLISWQKHVLWNSRKNKILILGEYQSVQNWNDFTALYINIQKSLTPQTSSLDIILTHQIHDFSTLCMNHNLLVNIISSQKTHSKTSYFTSLINRIFCLKNNSKKEFTYHLKIFKKNS